MAITQFLFVSTVEIKSPIPVLAQQKSKPIKNCGKSQENFSKTNGNRLGIAFLSSAQQCSAVLNLPLISKFLAFFDRVRVKDVRTKPAEVAQNPSKIGKTLGMLLKCLLVSSFKVKNMGMIAKTAELKPIKHCGKKTWKLQQNKWKKAGDCHCISRQCSAVLTLQLLPMFLEFLQG